MIAMTMMMIGNNDLKNVAELCPSLVPPSPNPPNPACPTGTYGQNKFNSYSFQTKYSSFFDEQKHSRDIETLVAKASKGQILSPLLSMTDDGDTCSGNKDLSCVLLLFQLYFCAFIFILSHTNMAFTLSLSLVICWKKIGMGLFFSYFSHYSH